MSDTSKFGTTVDGDTVADPLTTREDESDELFSDDEQKKQIECKSDTSLYNPISYRSETPLSLIDNSNAITPNNATIPSTPLSLIPFLNKINDQWSSDLETPQADKSAQTHAKPLTSATRNTEEISKLEQCTPEISVKNVDNKISSCSPVIVSKRTGKRPKRRRIFRCSISDTSQIATSNEHVTVNTEAPLTNKNTDSIAQDKRNAVSIPPIADICEIYESQVLNTIQDTFDSKELDKFRNTVIDTSDSLPRDLFTEEEILSKAKSEEQSKASDEIKDHKKPFVNDNPVEEIGIPTSSFSTGNGAPINFSKNAWNKALFLLADELHKDTNDDDNVLRKHEKLSAKRNCITVQNMMPSSLMISNNISEKSSFKEEKFVEQSNVPIEAASRIDTYVDNQFDRKTSNIGFQTARGVPISISEQAFSRAKTLLIDELDQSIHSNFSREANICNKVIKRQEVKFSNIRFPTDQDTSTNISEKILSKAKKKLLGEEDKPLELGIAKEDNIYNEETKKKETKILNIGFQTDRGNIINISEQTSSKTKTLLGKEFDKPLEQDIAEKDNIYKEDKEKEIEISNLGFRTGRGATINISEKALSKAKIFFGKELDEPLQLNVADKNNTCNEESKSKEIEIPNVKLQTSHAASVNISEVASEAKILFAAGLNEPLESHVIEAINVYDKKVEEQEAKASSSEFRTDCASIDISEKALSKSKILLREESDDLLKPIPEKTDEREIERKEMKISNIGFCTGHGISINISEKALSKAKTLFAEELNKSLQQNIVEEIDCYNKEAKNKVEIPNIGFRTGHGAPINISEHALSTAKTLFAEELNKSLQQNIVEEIDSCNKEVKNKVEIPNIGFRTGHGAPISISEHALSKAKTLFAEELNKSLQQNIVEEIDGCNKEVKNKVEIPNIGFRTGHGAPINISEHALSKAKTLFAEELNKSLQQNIVEEIDGCNKKVKNKVEIPNIGFRTGHEAPINISEHALSKAKTLFAEELNKSLQQNIVEEIDGCNKEVKNKVEIPNIGFRTGYGAPINISEHALSKAKMLFATELDKPLGLTDVEGFNVYNNEVQKQEVKTPNTEFRTGRGASINISEQALCKAKTLFTEHLDYPLKTDIPENIDTDDGKVKKHDTKISHCAFQTAGDQQTSIPNNALLKLTVSCNDHLNKNSSDMAVVSCASFQKRKLISDEATSLDRIPMSELKKARLSDEYKDTKLSFNNSGVDIINYEKVESENIYITNKMLIDEDMDSNRTTETSCVAILANTAEFDQNEEKQADAIVGSTLGSPRKDTSTESVESNIGSPVIGRQLASRKRKSLGHRKSKDTLQQSDKMIPDNAYVTTMLEKIAQENVSYENKTENKLNAEPQELVSTPMQMERQNTENNLSNTESTEYGDTQVMMDFIDESAQILQNRLAAALVQEKFITMKRRQRSKQTVGCLYRYKRMNSNARLSLREISNSAPPLPRSYQELIDQRIPPNILTITATTAASYKFRCSDFYGGDVARTNVDGIEMEDGARLIMDENGYVGIWEFLRAFLASPGVDPNLVPARWIENHYRWIVWKLASMDRMKLGSAELPRTLTPSHVMVQLKYRYDREIDRSERSAVRRILEKDDAASKKMILCVSSIVENNNIATEIGKSPRVGVLKWKIELTDGWYSVPACIDIGMMKYISTGKVREGTKLVVYGAELLNCDEGCYPLEASSDVCLKLHTNSTRRARWDTKLGYTSHSGPILIRLRDVCPSGGLIGKITVIIARVYPMLYHERTASGESIVRNAKCEEKMQMEYEQQCRSKMEVFYAKAEKDFQDLSCETDNIDMLAAQPNRNREGLYTQGEKFKQELQSKLRESLPAPRQVSLLLKIRVCDGDANAILSIWSPSEEIVDGIKEGACVSFRNIVASGKRGCELQLTARRSAILNPGIMQDTSYPSRMCTSLWEISNSEFSPPYGEFDTVGFVCSVGPAPYGMKDFEVVHLTYPKADLSNSSYISILFWQGIANFGYADILIVGSIVACNNLEWRRATSWNIPVAYCTDRSTFTRNPRRNHLYESFEYLRNLITDSATYIEKCSSELNIELQKKPTTRTPTRYTPGKNTPSKIYNSVQNSDKKLIDYSSSSTPRLGSADGRDFITTNSSIQKRFDKLQYYGEPPELSPITIRSSKRVSLDFRSPVFISDGSSTKNISSTHKSGHSDLSIGPEKQ